MQEFKTEAEALEYAENNLRKTESEFVLVDGRIAFLSATAIPLEERFREPIENIVRELYEEAGLDSEDQEAEDIIAFIGAKISTKLIKKICKESPIDIICAYQSY